MKRNTILIILSVMLGTLLYSLDQLIVATAMPKIVLELNGLSQLSWVFTAYMLTSTITIPIYGKLSDIYGRKVFYIIGIAVFLVGSLLSGIAQSMTQLIFFRALQGIGGGAMMVNAQAIIGDIFAPAERGRWQGLNMSMYGLATIAGPLLGGWLTDNFSWRWVFYINIPIGILTIGVAAASLPRLSNQIRNRTIDFAGTCLIVTGLVPLLLAFVWGGSEYPWISWQVLGLLAVAIVVLFTFILVERRARAPIISLSLFRKKAYTISVVIIFLTMIGMYGALLYIPLFAQGVVGISATNSGLVLMPMMVGLIIASVLAGQIASQTGKYKALTIVGMVVTLLAMALFTQIGIGTSNASLSWRMVILGIGIGIGMPIFTTVAQSAFGPERLGEVTAGKQLFQNIGGTASTAILGGVMNNQMAHQLTNIQNEPFAATIRQLNPAAALTKIDVNTIQQFLSTEGQAQIKALISKAPMAMQEQITASFSHFLNTIKMALCYAIDHMFIVSAILMFVALIIVFFLPRIPLRKHKHQTLEEVELEVANELGAQSDAEHNQDR